MKRLLAWMTIGSALGFALLSSHVDAQVGQIDDLGKSGNTRTSFNSNPDPMNPPALARLAATTLDGDIDDLLGMVGDLGGVGCAFEVDDAAMNVDCGDPDFVPCSDTTRTGVGPNSDFYFVNGYDLVKGVILYNAQDKELYLGLRVVGIIGDVDGDRNPDTICPSASSFIEEEGIGPQDSYRWEFDTACGNQFNPGPFLEIKGPTTNGQPLFDISGLTYDTVEMMWSGNGGVDSSEIEVKLTGVDLLTNFPNGGFQARVFVGTQRDCLGENSSGFGRCEPPVPALFATKTCVDVCAGDSTTCTIKVWNTGLVPMDLTVLDDIPTGHTYVAGSASGIGEPASAGGNDVLFTGPTLAVGDSVTFSFKVDTPEECFGEITNFATATGTYTSPCYNGTPNFRATDYDFDDAYQCLQNTSVLDIADQTKCEGDNVTFTAVATGENLSYQWYKGGTQGNPKSGTLLQGETGSSLSLTNLDQGDEAAYCVLVTGDCGEDWECAALTVDPPTSAQAFGDQTKCPDDNVTFTVSATGVNLKYQWYKGGTQGSPKSGTLIQGATSDAYTINGVKESDQATYCVLVTGDCGTAWQCALLTVDPGTTAGDIADQTKCEGDNVTFTVNATGENLFYQWYKGGDPGTPQSGTPLDTENGASLSLTSVMASDDAVYCVYVSGDCGKVWKCAKLSVLGAKLEVSGKGDEVCAGFDGEAVFTIKNTSDHTTDFKVECSVDGQAMNAVAINAVPSGETRTHKVIVPCAKADTVTVSCVVTATLPELRDCEAVTDPVVVKVTCLEPDVTLAKSTDPRITGDNSKVTIVVTNTGTSVLDPVRVSDHWPAGLTFDASSLSSNCGVSAEVENGEFATWVTFSDFSLAPNESCTIMFNVDCMERDNIARIDTAKVVAWCEGVDAGNPDNLIFAVTASDTSQVTCQGGEACPRTIGFWRQQARQRDNGSTKICLAGMKNLWKCVIDNTGVIEWSGSDIKFGVSLTEDVAKLPEGDSGKGQLFQWFEAQLQGPRRMTLRDMAELQYIGLMLNVCSGALPGSTPLSGSGGYSGTVAGAIDGIEKALNGQGGSIGYWKDVADAINNRVGVMAEPCPDGNAVMRNVSPCGEGVFNNAALAARVTLSAFPNPVAAKTANIQFNVPLQHADSHVQINLFDVSGRLVRKLVDGTRPAGLQTAHWDLRNDSGQPITAGIYFTRLRVASEERIIRLMVLTQD